ncbi:MULTISPECIES: hypothetical protein [Streptomyces]|uniref:hypothetical protein n=1 Tax=Streptomyces TaxID=1883 RepID=UPI001291F1FB|nr:hypothetical protein [Streptomyces sp. SYP-A7193]QFX86653.1 hypothetical protein GEV49_37810 [Streptomyces sp. SYP-A7193]
MAADGALRALRAAVFAAVCVVLAGLGHVLMSGHGLPWWVLLSGLAAVGAVGWSFGGRERRGAAVAALTVAVQAALHVSFTLAQSPARPSTAAAGGTQSVQEWARYLLCGADPTPAQAARAYGIAQRAGLTEHLHHGPGHTTGGMPTTGTTDMSGPAALLHLGHMTGTASWGMLAAHMLAAVLCGLWLAQGERAAFALVRACADRAFVPLRLVLVVLVPPAGPPAFRPVRRTRRRLRRLLLVHTLATRGPPRETAVV